MDNMVYYLICYLREIEGEDIPVKVAVKFDPNRGLDGGFMSTEHLNEKVEYFIEGSEFWLGLAGEDSHDCRLFSIEAIDHIFIYDSSPFEEPRTVIDADE